MYLEHNFETVDDLTHLFVEEVLDDLRLQNDVYDTSEPGRIENEWRNGFIPQTNGGYEGKAYANIGYAHSSGCIPSEIQGYVDQAQWDAIDNFYWANKIDLPEQAEDLTGWDKFNALYEHLEKLQETEGRQNVEEYWDVENESMYEGGTYFYKVRAIYYSADNPRNETGEDEVYFDVYLNTDFEYGRDYIGWAGGDQTKGNWKVTVKVSELTRDKVQSLIGVAIEALAELFK